MKRLCLLAALATTALPIGLGVVVAPAAHAAPPTIHLDSPSGTDVHRETNVHIAGRAEMPSGGTVHGQLHLALESRDGRPNQSVTLNVNGNPVPFAWDVPAAYNGFYTVKVVAQGRDGAFDTDPNEPTVYFRHITVEVLPVPPGNVRVETDKARKAVVRWDPNPEPDLIGYQVQRRLGEPPEDDPQGGWESAGETTGTELVDDASASKGGTYHYQVLALRRGAAADSGVWSAPSEPKSVDVADPPPGDSTTTTRPGGGTGGGDGGSRGEGGGSGDGSGSGQLAQTGKADLSGFSALLRDAQRRDPQSGRPVEDDGTYGERLPFEPGEEEEELGEDGTGLAIGGEEAGADQGDPAIAFVAASLLMTVIVMHLLWLKREVDRAPDPAAEPAET